MREGALGECWEGRAVKRLPLAQGSLCYSLTCSFGFHGVNAPRNARAWWLAGIYNYPCALHWGPTGQLRKALISAQNRTSLSITISS